MNGWYDTSTIGKLQIELTNYCNAACPMCIRDEMHSAELNNTNVSVNELKKWLDPCDWDNLENIALAGSVDEPVLNPEFIEILEYFLRLNEQLIVSVSTNGGGRSKVFWKKLGEISKKTGRVEIIFGIDGLEDTNHIYRRNVNWKRLQNNFREYINNGGSAIWQFIVFEHNKHQVESAQLVAKEEGFKRVKLRESSRPNKKGIYATTYFSAKKEKQLESDKTSSKVVCAAKPYNSNKYFHPRLANLYINHKGLCLPCCFFDNPNDLSNLLNNSELDIDKANLNYYSLNDIINGSVWKFINENMQTTPVCKRKCSLNGNFDKTKKIRF